VNAFTRFFTSVRLAIVLIIILTLASVLGTLIPQGRSASEYASRYGQLSGLMIRLQLTQLYHSFWYLALLFLLGLNIVVCTLKRLAPKWRRALRPSLAFDAAALQAAKVSGRFKARGPAAKTLSAVRRELETRRYRLRDRTDGRRHRILARKRALGWFGSDIVHLGLLVILGGGLVTGLAGHRTYLPLLEGQTAAAPDSDFEVRLDKFETILYPQGGVKDWKSTLTVLDHGREVLTRAIEVNHPLSYRGLKFYQSSFGWDWDNPSLEFQVRKKSDPAFEEKLRLRPGQTAALAPESEIKVDRFVPDFVIGQNREVQSRSDQPRNPAARVEISRGSETLFAGWVFANFPDFVALHSGADADFMVELKDVQAPQYSVLEAARDPGAGVVWAGCFLVMAGLALAFYWPTREILVLLEEGRDQTEVIIAGSTGKSRESFEAEFQSLLSSLRRKP
jgi:cytochrome c biogenesis protein